MQKIALNIRIEEKYEELAQERMKVHIMLHFMVFRSNAFFYIQTLTRFKLIEKPFETL